MNQLASSKYLLEYEISSICHYQQPLGLGVRVYARVSGVK